MNVYYLVMASSYMCCHQLFYSFKNMAYIISETNMKPGCRIFHYLCLCISFIMAEMHPYMWSKEDVYMWLDWCRKEYALSDVPLEKFSMNGKYL